MFFFFNDTATTEIYTLSLHDALPISSLGAVRLFSPRLDRDQLEIPHIGHDVDLHAGNHVGHILRNQDRKSTRLNSSHANISYAVFCLKKKKYRRSRTIRLKKRMAKRN